MVYSNSLRVAGDTYDDAIINFIRRRHGVLIGESTAERVKQTIATAWSESDHMEMEIKGRDISEGMARSLVITSEEVYDAIDDALVQIVQAIRQALEKTPPELSADIGEKGMVIAGGGALLRDMDRRLMQETDLPVVHRGRSADLRGSRLWPRAGGDRHAQQRVLQRQLTAARAADTSIPISPLQQAAGTVRPFRDLPAPGVRRSAGHLTTDGRAMIFGPVSSLNRFLLLAILSLGLMIVDHRSDLLGQECVPPCPSWRCRSMH